METKVDLCTSLRSHYAYNTESINVIHNEIWQPVDIVVSNTGCPDFNKRCEECLHRCSYPLCERYLTYAPKDNKISILEN